VIFSLTHAFFFSHSLISVFHHAFMVAPSVHVKRVWFLSPVLLLIQNCFGPQPLILKKQRDGIQ
jgi:hypothetical protein